MGHIWYTWKLWNQTNVWNKKRDETYIKSVVYEQPKNWKNSQNQHENWLRPTLILIMWVPCNNNQSSFLDGKLSSDKVSVHLSFHGLPWSRGVARCTQHPTWKGKNTPCIFKIFLCTQLIQLDPRMLWRDPHRFLLICKSYIWSVVDVDDPQEACVFIFLF